MLPPSSPANRRVFAGTGRAIGFAGSDADGHKFVRDGLKPLRPSSVSPRARALTPRFFPANGGDHGSQISDLFDPARRAGRHRAAGAADQHRAGHPAAARRHRARLRAGHAVAGIAARTGAAGGAAAADLFGQRRHELARIQIQPAPDHPAVGRLRDLHRLRGRRRDALPDRAAVERRLPARRHRRAAGRGGAAGDRPQARHAAPHPRRARGRGARQRRHRADPLPLRGGGDFDRHVFAAEGDRHLRGHRRRRDPVRRRGRLALPARCATARGIRRSRSRCR